MSAVRYPHLAAEGSRDDEFVDTEDEAEGYFSTTSGARFDRALRTSSTGGLDMEARGAQSRIHARLFGHQLAPAKIGKFVILKELGRGGMGVVFLARDPDLRRDCAIKLLRSRSAHDETAHLRILREAQSLARVDHPNVVSIHEVGEHDGRVYLAMELIEGETLERWQQTRGAWRELVQIYLQAGRGLAAAHAVGLVHRDFKPSNALVDADGRVRLIDFGLAHADAAPPDVTVSHEGAYASSAETRLTATGAVVGTVAYMSPEQFHAAPTDALSDQFSFCVSLYEALHGRRPFPGDSFAALSTSVLTGARPRVSRRLPQWLRRVLHRGLAREPSQRFPSMRALLGELERGLRRRGIFATAGILSAVVGLSLGLPKGADWIEERREHARQATCVSALDIGHEQVWNDARRIVLTRALGGAHDRFFEAVDELVSRSQVVGPELCSTAATAKPPACARQQLRELDTLLTQVERYGAETMTPETSEIVMLELVLDLDPPERCVGSTTTHELDLSPEDLATIIRARIDRVAGDYHGAASRLAALEQTLEDGGSPHALVIVQIERALALLRTNRTLAADILLKRAAQGARAQENDPALALRVSMLQIEVAAARGQYSRSSEYFLQSMILLGELSSTVGRRTLDDYRVIAYEQMAKVHIERGEYAPARLLLENERSLLGENPAVHRMAALRHNLAVAYSGEPEFIELARGHAEKALELREQHLGALHPKVAETLKLLADLSYDKQEFEKEREYRRRMQTILAAKRPVDDPRLAEIHLALARSFYSDAYYNSRRDLAERAIVHARTAIKQFRRVTDAPRGNIIKAELLLGQSMILEAETSGRSMKEPLELLLRNLAGVEGIDRAVIFNFIGDAQLQLDQLDRARESYKAVLAIAGAIPDELGPAQVQYAREQLAKTTQEGEILLVAGD